MPSNKHEVPLHMIRQRPDLAVEILRDVLGVAVPVHEQVVSVSENVTALHPAELNCDGAILANRSGKAVFGVVMEAQLRHDPKKLFSWPAYLATFRHRHQCPATLLVFCPDATAAKRFAAPIELGPPGSVVLPVTVSPEALPPITDPAEARRRPELAILTAPVHADTPQGRDVLLAYCEALESVDPENGRLYYDYAASRFSDAARKLLEEILKLEDYQWESDFAIKHQSIGRAEGRVEGEAKAILGFLRARGICVTDEARERITSCTDPHRLEHWIERATKITKVDELFD